MTSVVDLLQYLLEERGSDLLVKVGSPPCLRRNGKLERTSMEPLTPDEIEALATELLSPIKAAEFQETGETDLAHSVPGLGRFRINVYRQRGSVSLAIRRVVPGAPAIADLGVPPVVAELASQRDGLVIVAGPAASGKTTTAAAMLDHINAPHPRHIVTIEDPIEVLHSDREAIVSQREVGTDTADVVGALRRGPPGRGRDLRQRARGARCHRRGPDRGGGRPPGHRRDEHAVGDRHLELDRGPPRSPRAGPHPPPARPGAAGRRVPAPRGAPTVAAGSRPWSR